MLLHTQAWGEPGASTVVCLHGVNAHGARFRKLAEERLAGRSRVVAVDLRGHGRSGFDEPWDISTHVGDVLETVPGRGAWIGHSFGGRLVMEVTARAPERVERAVLIDPAIHIPQPLAGQLAAEQRRDLSFASPEEALEWRLSSGSVLRAPRELVEEEVDDHLERGGDGRFRFRYSPAAVARAYEEMATEPPPFERLRVPTLLVLAAVSKIVSAGELERYREGVRNLLEVVVVPGGHICLWDAFEETAAAIERFLAES